MENDEWRFSLSSEKYLEKTHVMVYLEDAISQLLDHKEDNPKVNPNSFFASYFASVKAGNHILLRDYNFIRATLHNRSSFVKAFWRCFANIGRKGDMLTVREYHSLACLLCPDIPLMLFQKTAKILLQDEAKEDSLVSFADFIYAFQLQICFDEFLTKSSEIYRSLMQNMSGNHLDTVVVPTSEERPLLSATESNKNVDISHDVDSMQFFRTLTTASERLQHFCPSVGSLRDVLSEKGRMTFYEFLTNLSKSAKLNEHIGKLPSKSELFTMTEQEMNLVGTTLENCWTRDFPLASPNAVANLPNATKLFEPVNSPTWQTQFGSNSGRLAGTDTVKSSESARWPPSCVPDSSQGTSADSASLKSGGRPATFRNNFSSVGNVSRREKTKGRRQISVSTSSSDDDIKDDLNSDSSSSSRN